MEVKDHVLVVHFLETSKLRLKRCFVYESANSC